MTVHRPLATVRLAAPTLDPDRVTSILKRSSKVAAKSGERLYPGSASKAVAKTGTWFLSTDSVSSYSPATHLHEVVALIEAHLPSLRQIAPDLAVSFSLLVYDRAATLPEALLRKAEAIGSLDIEERLDLQTVS